MLWPPRSACARIPVLIALIVINFTATVAVRERATAGVRGRSRLRPAEYISIQKTRNGTVSATTVALTDRGRKALSAYTQALRDLLGGL